MFSPENYKGLRGVRGSRGTFTPSVGEGFQDSKRPVVVSGLDRFFELKNLALKQRQELVSNGFQAVLKLFSSKNVKRNGPKSYFRRLGKENASGAVGA